MNGKKKILSLLYSVVFLDMLVYAMFVSTVSFLFLEGPYSILPQGSPYGHIYLGFYLSSYSLIQVFSAPFWGNRALGWGKKNVLFTSMLGNFFGYLFCFWGILSQGIGFLFLGTCLAGLFGANISMIQAYISYESKNTDWARYFSLLGFMMGLSFLLGPQISAYIIDKYKGIHICLFTTSLCLVVTCINLLLVYFTLQSDKVVLTLEGKSTKLQEYKAVFFSQWQSGLFPILLFFFGIHFGWVFFIKFYQVYLLETVGLNHQDCCQVTSYLGLSCALWQGLRYWGDGYIPQTRWWLFSMALIMGGALIAFSEFVSIHGILLNNLVLSFAYTMIIPTGLSLFLNHNKGGMKEQKTAIYQSVHSLVKVLAPILSGLTSYHSYYRVNLLGALAVFCAGFIIIVRPGLFSPVVKSSQKILSS